MQLDHLVFTPRDLASSLPFYAALFAPLGFRKVREHAWTNEQGVTIELRQAKDPEHRYARAGVGSNHWSVRAGDRAEVDRVVASVRAAGFEAPDPRVDEEGEYLVFIPDLDGLRVEVSAKGR